VHVESYLKSADESLDFAFNLGKAPYRCHLFDFVSSEHLATLEKRPLNEGGNNLRLMEDGVAVFIENDYLIRPFRHGFDVSTAGYYRITSVIEAY